MRSSRWACVCRAEIIAPSVPRDGNEVGGFCPNCGRSLERGAFKLRTDGWMSIDRSRGRGPAGVRWVSEQVPFPNPALVRVTDKPSVSMVKVRV